VRMFPQKATSSAWPAARDIAAPPRLKSQATSVARNVQEAAGESIPTDQRDDL